MTPGSVTVLPSQSSVRIEGGAQITLNQPREVSVAVVGIQGPAGASGSTYEHTQAAAASTWTINHNLGFRPNVQLRSVGHVLIGGDVQHPSTTQAIANLESPFAGYARCA